MFIWKHNQKRCNPYATYRDEQGTNYVRVPAELYEEIPDPVRESDETHYNQEIDEAPYLIVTPKSPEQLAQLANGKIKAQIAAIEANQARAVREAALGSSVHLQEIETKIQELRGQLVVIPEAPVNAG